MCAKAIFGATGRAGAVLRRIRKRRHKQQGSGLSTWLTVVVGDEEPACAACALYTQQCTVSRMRDRSRRGWKVCQSPAEARRRRATRFGAGAASAQTAVEVGRAHVGRYAVSPPCATRAIEDARPEPCRGPLPRHRFNQHGRLAFGSAAVASNVQGPKHGTWPASQMPRDFEVDASGCRSCRCPPRSMCCRMKHRCLPRSGSMVSRRARGPAARLRWPSGALKRQRRADVLEDSR